jgi:integrase
LRSAAAPAEFDSDPIESTASQRGRMPLTEVKIRATKPGDRQLVLVDALGLELLVTPNGARVWRFRFRVQGRQQRVTIGNYPEIGLAAARVEAARLRTDLLLGKDPAARTANGVHPTPAPPSEPEHEGLDAAVDSYLADHSPAWKSTTARTYRSGIRSFTAWASTAGVLTVVDLTPRSLASFRAHAVATPRKVKARGGSRHDVVSTDSRRSADAVNCQLAAVKTMLETLRRTGRLPLLTSDDIKDNLRPLAADHKKPKPLRPEGLRQLLVSAREHDVQPNTIPIFPLVVVMLLSGLRLGEALRLEWTDIDLVELTIHVEAGKTYRERTVDLTVSPALVRLLTSMRGRGRSGRVFTWTQATALDARLRLIEEFGAPAFLWSTRHSRPGSRSAPTLRSTCGCYLTCAPAIFGSASIYMSAAQLGHSAQIAERHYVAALRKIPKDATTLEAAMEIEDLFADDGKRLRLVGKGRVK